MSSIATAADLIAARRSHAHEQHVLTNANLFVEMTQHGYWKDSRNTIAELDAYASAAHAQLKDASREMQAFIKSKFNNDEDLLTKHADRMRTAGANIILLKDGLVPALKVDPTNPKFRILALQIFGYLRAEIEATKHLMM